MTPSKTKPPGWKDGGGFFWIKGSKFGQKCKCKLCGREVLGDSSAGSARMHWPSCEKRVNQEPDR